MSEAPHALTMDEPVESSLLDTSTQDVIGRPIDRVDGPRKVAGRATYAAEYPFDDLVHGVLVRATFGRGTMTGIDDSAARSVPGVIDVITDMETFIRNPQQGGETDAPTQGLKDVRYFGEIVAIVLADSFEAAREAAELVAIQHEAGDGRYDFEALKGDTEVPPEAMIPAHSDQGDLDAAMREAAFTIDATFTTPSQNSTAMEPHASIASWDADGLLTIHGAYQMPASDRKQLADALGLDEDKVRIVARYVGGGFGAKLGISQESVAAAIAARALGRPVKCVMSRQQVYDATVRRSNTEQRVRLAADADGRLTGIGHDSVVSNIDGEDFFEPCGIATHALYRGENRRITHDVVRLDWLLAGSMRAPGEAAGMLALECAMDELAESAGLDPIELRRRNEPDRDPSKDVPFSSRRLIACMEEGAARFGWDERQARTGQVRRGDELIGIGMAAAARNNKLLPSQARVRIEPDGRAVVETDMTDIGTGTYTILTQIAAEMLGLPVDRVETRLGDTDLPPGAGSGGSWGAGSSGSSVYLACEALRAQLAEAMECEPEALTLKDGQAIAHNRSVPIGDLVGDGIAAIGEIKPGEQEERFTQVSYGAHFCKVGVNVVTGEVRVHRFLGVFAAGRILNEKIARSQCIGGIVFGIGAALTEELIHDPRNGKVVNRDMAEYHVPVNADVPPIEVVFLEERDPHANPLHAKGIGELGISGAGAAIANAIYNATGVRVRDYPITLDKIIAGLPA